MFLALILKVTAGALVLDIAKCNLLFSFNSWMQS